MGSVVEAQIRDCSAVYRGWAGKANGWPAGEGVGHGDRTPTGMAEEAWVDWLHARLVIEWRARAEGPLILAADL
jgi:hypothetical protein